jgi:hypothetical protein
VLGREVSAALTEAVDQNPRFSDFTSSLTPFWKSSLVVLAHHGFAHPYLGLKPSIGTS